ncbi:MAG TPA: type II toxin-antitoxin system VapB family antitoxin [Acidobacteriota bacterium]|nr:type II toxin-antitoxin system VapB family antitoxin [Acidobacteriota bacterium]HQM62159.1 type II toxin-antitoxin system VapB family antitoxin [Acidobacteriota bacterium]
MRATVSIDESLLQELLAVCQGDDYSEAIKKALKEYVTWKKWERILTFGHRVEWDFDVLPRLDRFNLRNCGAICKRTFSKKTK